MGVAVLVMEFAVVAPRADDSYPGEEHPVGSAAAHGQTLAATGAGYEGGLWII